LQIRRVIVVVVAGKLLSLAGSCCHFLDGSWWQVAASRGSGGKTDA